MFAQETKNVRLYSFDHHGIYCGDFDYKWEVGTGLAANSTLVAPPKHQDGFVSVWNSESWQQKEDHREKTVYSTLDQSESKIDYVGAIIEGFTELKPSSIFEKWNGSEWVDPRTEEEKLLLKRQSLSKLSKRQFSLYLYDHQMYDQVMQAIEANLRFKIEYDAVSDIERLSPTVSEMTALLGWTDEQVDQMWEHALTL